MTRPNRARPYLRSGCVLACRSTALTVLVGTAIALLGATPDAVAQPAFQPGKAIRLLVGFPPGGSTDLLARNLGNRLGEQLGVQVIVDNRAGAAGNVADSQHQSVSGRSSSGAGRALALSARSLRREA